MERHRGPTGRRGGRKRRRGPAGIGGPPVPAGVDVLLSGKLRGDGTGDSTLFGKLWERHRAAWDQFVDLADLHIERIEIPYEGTTLPGYFFRSGSAGEPRRTLIFNNGSGGPVTAAWIQGIADALHRGWNAMTFDGPGQNAALIRQQLTFRPDWEKVITPVVDHLLTGPDVDAGKIALLGVSHAGYWVPRSVAFEHRIAAAVADPGVVDVSTAMFDQIPHFLAKMIDAGEQEKFDKDMEVALRFSAATRATMAFRMRPYGTNSAYEFFTAARAYALTDDVIGQITCPVLVTDPDHEQFWPGQSQELYDKLSARKALIGFTEEEGADSHCEPAANGIRGERIFNWLDQNIQPEPVTAREVSAQAARPGQADHPGRADRRGRAGRAAPAGTTQAGPRPAVWPGAPGAHPAVRPGPPGR